MKFKLKMIPPTATAQQKGERVVGGYIHHYKKKNVSLASRSRLPCYGHRDTGLY